MKCSQALILQLVFVTFALEFSAQAEEQKFIAHTAKLSNKIASGLEIRINVLGSSGRFKQEFTLKDPDGEHLSSAHNTTDLTTKGGSLLVGYAREYKNRHQSSYLYLGLESQKWNDAYDSLYSAFVIGLEGGVGSQSLKLIYGGEFAVGALDTGIDKLGYLATFTAEPYVGMRFIFMQNFSINMRIGTRFYSVEAVEQENGVNTRLSENSAYTANAQIGLGYSFY